MSDINRPTKVGRQKPLCVRLALEVKTTGRDFKTTQFSTAYTCPYSPRSKRSLGMRINFNEVLQQKIQDGEVAPFFPLAG